MIVIIIIIIIIIMCTISHDHGFAPVITWSTFCNPFNKLLAPVTFVQLAKKVVSECSIN